MRDDLVDHDPRAFVEWKSRNAGANRGKGDRPQSMLVGQFESASRRPAQAFGLRPHSGPHAGRVDDVSGLELAAVRDGRLADIDRADLAALGLDRWTAGPGDGARHAAAEFEVIVRGVDDRVHVLRGEVALHHLHAQLSSPPAHRVGCTCQAMDAIRASTSARVTDSSPRTLKCWIVNEAITIAYARARRTVSSFSTCCSARQPRKPAATASPAPVGSVGGSTGRAGRWISSAWRYNVAPFGPSLITSPRNR